MPSTAISAQGSTLEISTGTGAGLAVSAIAQSYPCRVTFTPSLAALSEGSVLTFASVGGMTQLNGNRYVAQYIDQTARIVTLADVDARGFAAYTSGGTGTPAAWTFIRNIKSFSGFDGQATELDTTNLESLGKEYLLGLVDEGGFSLELDWGTTGDGHDVLQTVRTSGERRNFRLTLPDGDVATFEGLVKKKSLQGGVDQVLKTSVEIRISGAVTFS